MKQEEKKMNNKKVPEFIPGPPGTGKTHRWLKNNYTGFLQESTWDRIVFYLIQILQQKKL